MRNLLLAALLCAATPALAQGAAPAAAAQPAPAEDAARARTQALIDTVRLVKKDGGKANEKVYGQLDGFLGFDAVMEGALAERADRFTPAQRKEFDSIFRNLLREQAYPNSGKLFTDAEVKLLGAKSRGEATVVTLEAYVKAEDLYMEVALHWKEIDGALRVVDVDFDGDSLVLDYRNQFASILDKEGADGLLAKVRERLAEVRSGGPQGASAKK